MDWQNKLDRLEQADPMGRLRRRHRILYVPAELVRRFFADMVSKSAAELAYFMLFSLFPLLIFLTAAMSRVNVTDEFWAILGRIVPQQVVGVMAEYLDYVASLPTQRMFYFGLGTTIFLFSRAINSLLRAINRIYRQEGRMGPLRLLASMLFSAAFLVSVVLMLALIVAGRVLYRYLARLLPVVSRLAEVWNLLRYGVVIAFVLLVLVMLYYVVPNRHIPLRYTMAGAVFTLITWVGMSVLLSFYVNNMNNYSALYGSLGAMMLLMLWLYLMGAVMLMGAVLTHILYEMHQPAQSS